MARTSLVPQQQVFLSEADKELLGGMERDRVAFNDALERYKAQLAELEKQRLAYNTQVEGYNKDLEAYRSSFVPGAKEGEIALVRRIADPNSYKGYSLYDVEGNVLPDTTQYSYLAGAGLPEGVFAQRTGALFRQPDPMPGQAGLGPTDSPWRFRLDSAPTAPVQPYKEEDVPKAPKAPFTEEEFTRAQEEAQARAQEAAGQRAVAIQAFEDPSKFGLSGFSGLGSRSFAKGGEVKEEGTKASRMMKELGFAKPPKEKTLADEPSKLTPETLAYSLRAQSEGNKDKDLRRGSFSAPGALSVKRFERGGEARSEEGFSPIGGSMGMPGAPEHVRAQSDTLGFIKRMDDASVMATASRMTGLPFDSPTQARLMLEKMLGEDTSVSAGVSGIGQGLPERVVGYDVGAKFPALGGQMSVGATIPRGPGSPAFNLGYRRQFSEGGDVSRETLSSPEEQPVTEESSASRQLRELIRPMREGVKGYFGMEPERSGSEAYRMGQALSNMPGAGTPATLGIFIGKSSKLWNKAMNEAARKMEKAGAPAEEIWQKTGNFKGPDNQWRQEISDIGATHRSQVTQGPASMVLEHPELYQSYPDMKDIFIRTDPYTVRSNYMGAGVPGAEEINLGTAGGKVENVRGLLHEMQHGIQFREGFGLGGNKTTAFNDPKAFEILDMIRKRVSTPATLEEFAKGAYQTTKITPEIEDAYKNTYLKNYAANLKSGGLDRMAQDEAARIYYNRLLGETEARAVEDRRLFTPEQRLETFPTKSYKVDGKPVAVEDLIIKRPMERAHGGPVNKHDAFIKAKQ